MGERQFLELGRTLSLSAGIHGWDKGFESAGKIMNLDCTQKPDCCHLTGNNPVSLGAYLPFSL